MSAPVPLFRSSLATSASPARVVDFIGDSGSVARNTRIAVRFWLRPLHTLLELAADGAPVRRLGTGWESVYLVNDPQPIQQILVDRRDAYARQHNAEVPFLREFLSDGLLTTDGDTWLRLRRASQPAFLPDGVARVADRVAESTEAALDQWAPWRDGARHTDLFPELVTLTATVAMRAFFGHRIDRMGSRGIADALLFGQEHIVRRIRAPFWPSSSILPQNRRFEAGNRFVAEAVARAVAARQDRSSDDGVIDLYDVLMARSREQGTAMDLETVHDQFLTDFIAAPENTATAITWALYLLARHPEVEAGVLEEVATVLGDGRPTLETLSRMPLLDRVVSETLRLYPGAPYFDRRALEDDVLAGVPVPRGAIVFIAPFVLHRAARFWSDPEQFRPERFAPGGEGVKNPAYIPFGLGPRKCLGDRFALLVIKTVLTMMMQRVRLRRQDPAPIDVDPRINLRPAGGLWMSVERRQA